MTSAVMPQPNNSMQEPCKAMPQSNKVMQEPSKAMPQVHADYQNSQIPPTVPIINNPLYNQGWLQTQIGKYIRVIFYLELVPFKIDQVFYKRLELVLLSLRMLIQMI